MSVLYVSSFDQPSRLSPLTFYDNRDIRNNGMILNSMLSVDNNKNNFYQPKGWLPLETC